MAEQDAASDTPELAQIADLDLDRSTRRGYPEAVYCTHKSVEQLAAIAAALRDQTGAVNLFTRASAEQAKAILTELPDAFVDLEAGLLAWPAEPPPPTGGLVVVLTAGTSDLPMAREALLTARYLGRPTELVVDVGVAGLHRVLERLPLLRRARVIIVAAGMDGALPSVVAGLVSAPGRRAADVGRVRRRLRRSRPAAGHAELLRARRGRGQHRQRLRRRSSRRPDRRSGMTTEDRHAWIDASAGVAGDMLLGALLDAGASLTAVQEAVDAVIPGSVQVGVAEVNRAGLRATKAELTLTAADQPHRSWRDVRGLLTDATLTSSVRARATAVFARLAEAEGAVHGIAAEDVHFHEVGALDSIADIVGVCAALADLGIASVSAGPVAVGAGRVTMAHGEVGVPVPAVVELARGWRVRSGGSGELATPTGMALVVELAGACEDLPELLVSVSGSGAGSRDFPDRANVTRVVIGYQRPDLSAPDLGTGRPPRGQRRRPGPPAVARRAERAAGGGRLGRLAGADRDEEGPARARPLSAVPTHGGGGDARPDLRRDVDVRSPRACRTEAHAVPRLG